MNGNAAIILGLAKVGRPRAWRRFLASFVVSVDFLVLSAPFLAILVRMELGAVSDPLRVFTWLLATLLVFACTFSCARLFANRRDPLLAARSVDEMGKTKELFLTAADYVLKGRQSLFLPALLERATAQLPALEKAQRPHLEIPLIAFKRDMVALILTALILVVPSFAHGALGPEDEDQVASEDGEDQALLGAKGTVAGESSVLGFEGKVKIRVRSDQKLYFLGDEITLIVEVETLEPIPPDIRLGAVALVDGEANMPLPVGKDLVLPRAAGEKIELRMKIKERLKAIGRYRRGLLTIDPFLYAKTQAPGFDGPAPGNRVVLQIAENAEKLRAKTPSSVKKQQKKKPKPKNKPKKKDNEKKPQQKKKQQKKPRPAPGKNPAAKPPGELKTKPFVVQPLFSNDQTKKRSVRVFDREKEKGTPPPSEPMRANLKTRGYEKVQETQLQKMKLGNQERRQVRTYLNGIRNKQSKTKKNK